MAKLTDEQINDIAEKCGCGYFEYGDAQGKVRLDFARAIEKAMICQQTDFPVLKILEKHLKAGAKIAWQDKAWHLFGSQVESLAYGETIADMLVSLIFREC